MNQFVDDLIQNTKLNISIDKHVLESGDSFYRIFEEIGTSDYLIVILSKNSITSNWCKKEITTGMVKDIQEEKFNLLPIVAPGESLEELKKSMDVGLNTMLLDKHWTNFDDESYNEVLMRIVKHLIPEESAEELYSEIFDSNQNPFWRVRAEHFAYSQTFVNLFEDPETTFKQMMSPKPTLIVGGRGSGKTMLLKSVRASIMPSIKNTSSLKDSSIPYVGIYFRATRGTFSLTGVNELRNNLESTGIFYDEIILRLTQSLILELMECTKIGTISMTAELEESICNMISKQVRLEHQHNSFVETEEAIQEKLHSITDYVRSKIRNTNTPYMIQGLQSENLERICVRLKELVPELSYKYVTFLIDEYENFMSEQKTVINTLVKLHNASSFTFGADPSRMRTLPFIQKAHVGGEYPW